MGKGYVLINRQIEDNWIWTDKPFSKGQAWVDLILMANYKDTTVCIKGHVFEIKRGQLLRSLDFLGERWGWSRKKIRTFLCQLEGHAMGHAKGTPAGTLITIENYTFWQTLGHESGHAEGTPKGPTRVHVQLKDNKYLNKKKNYKGPRPPSFQEIIEFIKSHNYEMNPEEFFDYYEEVGWIKKNGQPIKDWRASARAWERRVQKWKTEKDGAAKRQMPDGSKIAKEIEDQKKNSEQMPDYMRKQIRDRRKRNGGGAK